MAEHYVCKQELNLGKLRTDVEILLRDAKADDRRLDKLECKSEGITEISTAITVMSMSLEHIVDHNKKQDIMMEKQGQTLKNINENLSVLNQGQANLEGKVEKLESRVDENENLNMVDLRAIQKQKNENFLKDYAGPLAVGMGVGALLLEIIKTFL